VLFKPQFEVGRTEVGKGGIVRDADVIGAAALKFRAWCDANGYTVAAEAASALAGAEGNREIFFHLLPR
jgi:23S rRNA (cytidine1920-2'-O)/16S rRNA (cytidine1409-2'-O)-methyltransferase